MILIVKLLNFIKCCGNASNEFQTYINTQAAVCNLHFYQLWKSTMYFLHLIFGICIYHLWLPSIQKGILEYLILWIFIFDYKSNDIWDFSLFHFSLLSTSRFTCSHFFLALVKHTKKYFDYFFLAFFNL